MSASVRAIWYVEPLVCVRSVSLAKPFAVSESPVATNVCYPGSLVPKLPVSSRPLVDNT